MYWKLVIIVIALLNSGAVLCAEEPDANEGKRLLDTACVQCHGLRPIELTRDGKPGWEDTIEKMVLIGAQLSPEEVGTLAGYLARNFGPAAGDPMRTGVLPADAPWQSGNTVSSEAVALPEGPGRQLVGAYCLMCHDAGRIVATRRSADAWRRYTINMLAQAGMSVTPDKLETMVTYLTDHFGAGEPGTR